MIKKIVLGLILCILHSVVNASEPEVSQKDFLLCPDPFEQPAEFRSKDQAVGVILDELSSGLNIKGVVVSGDKSYVIINQKIISEGDDWNGLKIDKIFPDKLILRYKNEIKEFNIKQEEENPL